MHDFLAHLLALEPYTATRKAFTDPRNERVIASHLTALADETGAIEHFSPLQTIGFSVSAGVLQDHVRATRRAFLIGRKDYARWMATETVQGCIACHSQLPAASVSLTIDPEQIEGTDLDRADFLFASRQFDRALKLYDRIIAEYRPSATVDPLQIGNEAVDEAVARKLAIDLRVRRDPAGAANSLEADLANGQLPPTLRDAMKAWIGELREPGLLPKFDPAKASRSELEAYATSILGPDPKEVNLFTSPKVVAPYLVLSGVLYEALATPHGDLSPSEILRWLAACDRALSRRFLFSLSELYLQECIHRAPHTPVAAACDRDFEASVEMGFTGSSGTHVPEDMTALLKKLRKEAE